MRLCEYSDNRPRSKGRRRLIAPQAGWMDLSAAAYRVVGAILVIYEADRILAWSFQSPDIEESAP